VTPAGPTRGEGSARHVVGRQTAEGPGGGARNSRRAGRPPARQRRRNFVVSDAGPFEPPFLCLTPPGAHTLLCRVDEPGEGYESSARTPRRTPPASESTRGARMLGSGYRAAPRARAAGPRRGGPARVRLPTRRASQAAILLAGLKTSLLYKLQRARRRPQPRATSPPTTSARAQALTSAPSAPCRRGTGLARRALGGGVAPTGRCASAPARLPTTSTSADRAVHRQNAAIDRKRRSGRGPALPSRATRARRVSTGEAA